MLRSPWTVWMGAGVLLGTGCHQQHEQLATAPTPRQNASVCSSMLASPLSDTMYSYVLPSPTYYGLPSTVVLREAASPIAIWSAAPATSASPRLLCVSRYRSPLAFTGVH